MEGGEENERSGNEEIGLLLLAHALLRRARQVMLKTCVPEVSIRDEGLEIRDQGLDMPCSSGDADDVSA